MSLSLYPIDMMFANIRTACHYLLTIPHSSIDLIVLIHEHDIYSINKNIPPPCQNRPVLLHLIGEICFVSSAYRTSVGILPYQLHNFICHGLYIAVLRRCPKLVYSGVLAGMWIII
ncbi:hypothetical protein VTL71DRAFT_9313 [Oculimacula yallundae]|uniref:Uncharacterized protein n=1 Tax=Oculimacula yallundae TaxID=86028 RepID=A0ABR4BSN9_9HELO